MVVGKRSTFTSKKQEWTGRPHLMRQHWLGEGRTLFCESPLSKKEMLKPWEPSLSCMGRTLCGVPLRMLHLPLPTSCSCPNGSARLRTVACEARIGMRHTSRMLEAPAQATCIRKEPPIFLVSSK